MSSYQHTTIVGNVGSRPRTNTVNGKEVCNFSVAVNSYKGDTQWFRVSVWGKQAAACIKYINKGNKVLVDGELNANLYTGRDNEPKISLNLNARTVKFLTKDGYIDKEANNPIPF